MLNHLLSCSFLNSTFLPPLGSSTLNIILFEWNQYVYNTLFDEVKPTLKIGIEESQAEGDVCAYYKLYTFIREMQLLSLRYYYQSESAKWFI